MMTRDTQRGTPTDSGTPGWTAPPATAPRGPRPADDADGPTRLGCTLCSEPFLLDPEEFWGTPPEEMEVLGREFLSVRADAALCPRCLHEVQRTGAERIYWRLACC